MKDLIIDKKVYIIGIGPGGKIEYLTIKAYQLIQNLDVLIYNGEMISDDVKSLIKGEKYIGSYNQKEIEEITISNLNKGKKIGILEPGDPSLFSGQLNVFNGLNDNIKWLKKLDVSFEIVPGITSWLAASANLLLDNTILGENQTVILTSPFQLSTNRLKNDIKSLLESNASLILFMSISKIDQILKELIELNIGDFPLIICDSISWNNELILKTTINKYKFDKIGNKFSKSSTVFIGKGYNN